MLGGDQVAGTKPWPDGIELARWRLGVPAAEAAY